jgi:hypothetical protein
VIWRLGEEGFMIKANAKQIQFTFANRKFDASANGGEENDFFRIYAYLM